MRAEIPYDEQLMSPGEVARALGVDSRTVARWTREGRIAAIRTPGGERRYRRADVDEQIAASEYPPPRPS
jgi:excisionase family DNA binding protein